MTQHVAIANTHPQTSYCCPDGVHRLIGRGGVNLHEFDTGDYVTKKGTPDTIGHVSEVTYFSDSTLYYITWEEGAEYPSSGLWHWQVQKAPAWKVIDWQGWRKLD